MWNFVFGYELGKKPKIGYVTMKSKGAWMLSSIITNMLEPITKHNQIWELMGYGRKGAIHWWSLLHSQNNWVKYIFIVRCNFYDFILIMD